MKKATVLFLAMTLVFTLASPCFGESNPGPKTETAIIQADGIPAILAFLNREDQVTVTEAVDEKNCLRIFGECPIVCEAFDGAEEKAMLVNTLLSESKTVKIIAGSGMAGFGRANEIVTRKISERLFVCGDGKTDVADGEGLTASRVIICAGHIASKAVEMILT